MKKIFVLIPPQYGMTNEEVDSYMKRREELCHKAEVRLGEYCEVSYQSLYSFGTEAKIEKHEEYIKHLQKNFIKDNVEQLIDSDYAVFGAGCESSDECRLLRYVAERYNVKILEV